MSQKRKQYEDENVQSRVYNVSFQNVSFMHAIHLLGMIHSRSRARKARPQTCFRVSLIESVIDTFDEKFKID